jgi:ABC-type amino acid transport substrate-binding protein
VADAVLARVGKLDERIVDFHGIWSASGAAALGDGKGEESPAPQPAAGAAAEQAADGTSAPPPAGANITSLPTDNECLQAQAAGRKFDAIVANENSLANGVKEGIPIKILDVPPPFVVQVAFALDKSGPPTADMLKVLNKIVADMHADGTLTKLSMQYLGKDVTLTP